MKARLAQVLRGRSGARGAGGHQRRGHAQPDAARRARAAARAGDRAGALGGVVQALAALGVTRWSSWAGQGAERPGQAHRQEIECSTWKTAACREDPGRDGETRLTTSKGRSRWSPAARAASAARSRWRSPAAARRWSSTTRGNEAAAHETPRRCIRPRRQGEARRFDVSDAPPAPRRSSGRQGARRLDILVNNAGVAIDGLVMRSRTRTGTSRSTST